MAASRTVAKASGRMSSSVSPFGEPAAEQDRSGCASSSSVIAAMVGSKRVDLVDDLAERADVAVVRRPENGFGNSAEHVEILSCLNRRCARARGAGADADRRNGPRGAAAAGGSFEPALVDGSGLGRDRRGRGKAGADAAARSGAGTAGLATAPRHPPSAAAASAAALAATAVRSTWRSRRRPRSPEIRRRSGRAQHRREEEQKFQGQSRSALAERLAAT